MVVSQSVSTQTVHVYVLGLDEHNHEMLRNAEALADCRFHPLLTTRELKERDEIRMRELIDRATEQLRAAPDPPDAIVGYWDFPVSSMIPILASRFGLRSASLESVVKCEHKYWSRLEQKAVTDTFPRFALVELDADVPPEKVDFPMWLKPVKSFGSGLAYLVRDHAEFAAAMDRIREGIDRLGDPFEYVLQHLRLPDEVAAAGARSVVAEELITGEQVTVEGYCRDGEVTVYGAIDSVSYPDSPSFLRYEYPSALPPGVLDRISKIVSNVIRRIGLDNVMFNVELFWDRDQDTIKLLEINPRHSQSHAKLFELVDGAANHQCMVALALGREPHLPHRRGPYSVAAKWFLRGFDDGIVRRAPSAEDLSDVSRLVPGATARVLVKEGDQLSETAVHDSYSFELAQVFVGAADRDGLVRKYEQCLAKLPFEIGTEAG